MQQHKSTTSRGQNVQQQTRRRVLQKVGAIRHRLEEKMNQMCTDFEILDAHQIHHVSTSDKLNLLDKELSKFNDYWIADVFQQDQQRVRSASANNAWRHFGDSLNDAFFDLLDLSLISDEISFTDQRQPIQFSNNHLLHLFSTTDDLSTYTGPLEEVKVSIPEWSFLANHTVTDDYQDILVFGQMLYILTNGHLTDSLWKKVMPFTFDGLRNTMRPPRQAQQVQQTTITKLVQKHAPRDDRMLTSRERASLQDFLRKNHGGERIQSLDVIRTPEHVALFINGKYLFDKQDAVRLRTKQGRTSKSQVWTVPVPFPLTIGQLVENGVRKMGGSFGKYDPVVNHARRFVQDILRANGLLTAQTKEFLQRQTLSPPSAPQQQHAPARRTATASYQQMLCLNKVKFRQGPPLYYFQHELNSSCIGSIATIDLAIREDKDETPTGSEPLIHSVRYHPDVQAQLKKRHWLFFIHMTKNDKGHMNCFLFSNGVFFYIEPNGSVGDENLYLKPAPFKIMWQKIMHRLARDLTAVSVFRQRREPVCVLRDADERPYRKMHSVFLQSTTTTFDSGYCVTIVLLLVELFRQNTCFLEYPYHPQKVVKFPHGGQNKQWTAQRLRSLYDIYTVISQATGHLQKDLEGFNVALANSQDAMKRLKRRVVRPTTEPRQQIRRPALRLHTAQDKARGTFRKIIHLDQALQQTGGDPHILQERLARIGSKDNQYAPLRRLIDDLYKAKMNVWRRIRKFPLIQFPIPPIDNVLKDDQLDTHELSTIAITGGKRDLFRETLFDYVFGRGDRQQIKNRLKRIILEQPIPEYRTKQRLNLADVLHSASAVNVAQRRKRIQHVGQLLGELYAERMKRFSLLPGILSKKVPLPQQIFQHGHLDLDKLQQMGTGTRNSQSFRDVFLAYLQGKGDSQRMKDKLKKMARNERVSPDMST